MRHSSKAGRTGSAQRTGSACCPLGSIRLTAHLRRGYDRRWRRVTRTPARNPSAAATRRANHNHVVTCGPMKRMRVLLPFSAMKTMATTAISPPRTCWKDRRRAARGSDSVLDMSRNYHEGAL